VKLVFVQTPQNELSPQQVIHFLEKLFGVMALASFGLLGILRLILRRNEKHQKDVPPTSTDVVMSTGETSTPKH
jgi:hypothetical protein